MGKTEKINAYGYARVSTKKQEAEGYSLEAQRDQIEEYCKNNSLQLKGFYSEAMSGTKDDRPKLQEALELCKLSDGVLIVAKIDRLTRDLHFLTKLQKENVRFIAVDNPHANETMLQVMISFAQMENKLRSTRIKEGMRKAKEKGKKFGTDNLNVYWKQLEKEVDKEGRIPIVRKRLRELLEQYPDAKDKYDFRKKVVVESDIGKEIRALRQEEAEFIEKVRNRKAQIPSEVRSDKALERARSLFPIVKECQSEGATSYRKLAECLTEKGIKTPLGRDTWNVGSVQTLMVQIKKIEAE